MNLLLGIFLAFIALLSGSPLIALFLGICLTLFIGSTEGLIHKSIGTKLLQIGIVFLGLTISSSSAITLTMKYFPYISIFVVIIFFTGILISKILKVDPKLSILLASGTAICGATAMVAISPLIRAKPKDLLMSLGIIFLFNAVAIVIFPIIGHSIGMPDEQFGFWMAMAVHDTSSVIGAAMSFGGESVETAATLKLGRTLWLIPLIIILGTFYKDNKNTKSIIPLFVFIFILAILVGTQADFTDQVISVLENISSTFFIGALFCIGTQINSRSIKEINFKTILLALLLWLFALLASYYLINVI